MGNIITNQNGDIKESVLGNIINDWAKNDYDAGLNYKKDESSKIKKLLKKRSCCIKSPNMKIALPKCIISPRGVITSIEETYHSINIQNLYSTSRNYKEECNNIDNINSNYAQPEGYNNGASMAETKCMALYTGEGDELGLCENIRNERKIQLTNLNEIAYGRYREEKNNVYSDCNCINSILRDSTGQDKNGTGVDSDIIVQAFDIRCSGLIPTVYNTVKKNLTNLCVNSINLSDSIVDKSTLSFNQACGSPPSLISKEDNAPSPIIPIIPSTKSSSSASSSNIFTPMNIIIFISTIIITSILMIVYVM
jgi:hypothetical protein